MHSPLMPRYFFELSCGYLHASYCSRYNVIHSGLAQQYNTTITRSTITSPPPITATQALSFPRNHFHYPSSPSTQDSNVRARHPQQSHHALRGWRQPPRATVPPTPPPQVPSTPDPSPSALASSLPPGGLVHIKYEEGRRFLSPNHIS